MLAHPGPARATQRPHTAPMQDHGEGRRAGEPTGIGGLRDRARALAERWGAEAGSATTVASERAILRLCGVDGLDHAGRPLAAEVVERYLAGDPSRLAGGLAIPFATALDAHNLEPHALALAVADGRVDLALEAQALNDPVVRAAAERRARELVNGALERVDANRLARRELVGMLGEPASPWTALLLRSPAIVDALDEAHAAIEAGAGLLAVDVPPVRELAQRAARSGAEAHAWHAAPGSRGGLDVPDPFGAPVPAGAQRALTVLRRAADEAGARAGAYIRLLTDAQPLGAPEQAVVAGLERIDAVVADPMREIADGSVGPGRVLADHAFAQRLLARAGVRVVIPVGPLVVGPELAAGTPSDAATRSGRALALQLLAVELARHHGIADDLITVGALPDWIADERDAPAIAAAEVHLRGSLFAAHGLAFMEPDGHVAGSASTATATASGTAWGALVAALLPQAPTVQLVMRRAGGSPEELAGQTRAATAVAAGLREAWGPVALGGAAKVHEEAVATAARATLDGLAEGGWGWLLGSGSAPDADDEGVIRRTGTGGTATAAGEGASA